ncbi:ubiquitin-conjugating enzyme E2 W-like [Myzus persicae]|uniref:ubiquitin-conjugating enzyme E2 W-like n=1 Tax=Myzus persicae TaxID=13164 RepID=UPI000B938724|nr:ubiquitin-conjugating enzyme E2 W-like [Myzus persicae]
MDRTLYEKRLLRELKLFVKEPPQGMFVNADQAEENLKIWIVNMKGVEGTLYDGEQFQLQFKFDTNYPFESPEVTFIGQNIPVHPHVYSNGHICLSILNTDWSPALTAQSVCLSIMSMLSSCKEKKKPVADHLYVQLGKRSPKETMWFYHDDGV